MFLNKKIIISCTNAESLINFRGRLIKRLLEHNRVHVITPFITAEETRKNLLALGLKIHETKINRNGISIILDIRYTLKLIQLIKEIKPDIFFAYTFKPVIFGTLAATFCRVKNINAMLTGLGYSFANTSDNFLTIMSKKMLRFSLKINKNLKIIFQNSDDHQELLNKKIISKYSRAFVVNGSGVDLSHYHYSTPDITKFTFVMFSRLIKSKGVVEFYDAARIIKKKYPEVKFILAGGYIQGSTDSIDNDLFLKIKNDGIIEYLGWITDVRSYIEQSSAIVLPSYYREGVPRSLLESLAMGRPIITTNMIGCRETVCTIPGKENGFAVPAKDVNALVSKMEYLINFPYKIIELGKNGRLFAEEKFDVEKVNQQMVDILAS